MNKAIEIQFPRTLLLDNVVHTRADPNDPTRFQEAVVGLNRFIRAQGAAPRGPLVQVTQVAEEPGAEPRSSELLRQASLPISGDADRYRFSARLEVAGCVLARFQGDAADLHIVYNKLAVFSYENDIPLSGRFHAVFLEQEGPALSADVFASTSEEP